MTCMVYHVSDEAADLIAYPFPNLSESMLVKESLGYDIVMHILRSFKSLRTKLRLNTHV